MSPVLPLPAPPEVEPPELDWAKVTADDTMDKAKTRNNSFFILLSLQRTMEYLL